MADLTLAVVEERVEVEMKVEVRAEVQDGELSKVVEARKGVAGRTEGQGSPGTAGDGRAQEGMWFPWIGEGWFSIRLNHTEDLARFLCRASPCLPRSTSWREKNLNT